MEQFPPEFVLHHVPLFAVLGLGTGEAGAAPGTQPQPPPPASGLPGSAAAAGDSLAARRAALDGATQAAKRSLLALLLARNNASVWDTRAPRTLFRTIAIDKVRRAAAGRSCTAHTAADAVAANPVHLVHLAALSHVACPNLPRPHAPPASPLLAYWRPTSKTHSFPRRQSAAKTAGSATPSPLSPLNPASPMFPDGIISPLWVGRHRDVLPAVVVGFYELWESVDPSSRRDPLGAQQVSSLERDRDLLLVNEINEKR
nr:hypothetical protein HK105_005482 [Polyrhizophydium stewartii]